MTGEVPHRRPPRVERERRRARRASPRLDGRFADGGTGHPVLFSMRPALELGTFPDGGGYPVGFVEAAAAAMGCDDLRQIVHLCAGSVHGGLITIDARADAGTDGIESSDEIDTTRRSASVNCSPANTVRVTANTSWRSPMRV